MMRAAIAPRCSSSVLKFWSWPPRSALHSCGGYGNGRSTTTSACRAISLLSERQSSWKRHCWQPSRISSWYVYQQQQQQQPPPQPAAATRRHFVAGSSPPPRGGDDDSTEKEKEAAAASASSKSRPNTASSSTTSSTTSTGGTSIIPGLALSYMTALAGFTTASAISATVGIPLSGIPVSILLGMTIKNTLLASSPSSSSSGIATGTAGTGTSTAGYFADYNNRLQPGITFCTKTILQAGIVFVAAKLSLVEVLSTGTAGIPVVVSSMTAGMLFIPLASRLAGLPTQMALLLTAGTSICGVTAITALAPAIQAPPRDVAVAVANTVAFGTMGMLTYPYLFHAICTNSEMLGMCLGVSIHDTSQVLGAALSCKEVFGDEVAFKVAAVTKLMRNLGLAIAIPALTYSYHASIKKQDEENQQQTEDTGMKERGKIATPTPTMSGLQTFTKYVPPFLVAFLGVSALRSIGDYAIPDMEAYQLVMNFCGNELSKNALGMAMAAVGLSTSAASLRGVGWKPFAVGAAGALVVGGTGFTVAMLTVG